MIDTSQLSIGQYLVAVDDVAGYLSEGGEYCVEDEPDGDDCYVAVYDDSNSVHLWHTKHFRVKEDA